MSVSDDQVFSPTQDLVVIGASAGGIEALSILVSSLPPDFPAPIVLAQHLDPNRQSMLPEILERRTSLVVQLVQSRSQLEPGSIYVVPANYHVAIQDGHVEILLDHQRRPKPSVDRLLSTAAEMYGERLIAVILTGSGSDGASGAVDVKEAGGTVIVQNPQTARYPSMPMSLPPTVIDFEADIERIGPLIYDLLTGAEIPPPDKSQDVLRHILEHVNRQANIDFRAYKTTTVLRRIARRMTVTHNSMIRDYAEFLEAHPEEVGDLVQALLINVTQFFRDPESFAYLRQIVLPALLDKGRERGRVLRFWSAGCSSGEEPYSLAMLVADLLGADLPQWSIKIFATDLDEAAITFARLGVYPENLLKDMPQDYRERFFERVDLAPSYRIAKTLRQMVIFGQQDLSRSAPFPRMDLVLCRNVLIYFTPDLQDYVLNQFAFSLQPSNGYLFLGKAEIIRSTHSYFDLVNKQWKIYRCTGETVPMLRRQGVPALSTRLKSPVVQSLVGRSERVLGEHESLVATDLALLRRMNELLLRFLPTGVVVIDRVYHVLTLNTAARKLLGLRDIGSEQDFLHSVRGIPYAEVRSAIDSVFRERSPVTLPEVLLESALGGTGHYLCLTIVPMQADVSTADLVAISVTDVTEQIQNRQRLETAQAEQAQLLTELGAANKRLNEMNKELLDANEELQVANEEMMLTYEELQATNEEFEATNEELQATNEELETNNEELQATNEELQTTNDELRARTIDLQELATMLESDRGRFAEMVELAPFHIIVLRGPQLLVEAFNPSYARLLESHELRGRPLVEVAHYFWQSNVALVDLAREVYHENTPRTSQRMQIAVPNAQGASINRYFVYMLVPTHDNIGNVDGVAIYATDVTEQRTQEVLEERERLRLIFQHTEQMALGLYDAESMELVMATPQYLQLLRRAYPDGRQSFMGSLWYESAFIAQGEAALQLWHQARDSLQPVRLREAHLTLVHDSEETVWNWSLVPIMDPIRPHQIRFMMAMGIEITEQVHAREEVERLDHLKDEFLSLASHELRTPLTSLIGNAYIMERLVKDAGAGTPPEQLSRLVHYVGSIRKQLERLNVLIEDLIDVSRLQSGKYTLNMERVEMRQVVRQAVDEARLISQQPSIVVDAPADDPLPVWGDRVRLMQVLLNLLQNALSYASNSGHIDVRVRHENDPSSSGQIVRIEVQDYGPGIAPEDQAAIFSRFYQADNSQRSSHRGLGLGLFICKQLVEQHNGSIVVNSRVGQGSTFVIELPLYNG
ncbi:MAG TPA: CheR family methyltransferase [Herpetosiphonaceae bacterium]